MTYCPRRSLTIGTAATEFCGRPSRGTIAVTGIGGHYQIHATRRYITCPLTLFAFDGPAAKVDSLAGTSHEW